MILKRNYGNRRSIRSDDLFFSLLPKFGNKFILFVRSKIVLVGAPMSLRDSAYSDMATLG